MARLSVEHGTILSMPVVLLLAAIAILAGVVVVAIGRGGELTVFRSDVPPLRLEFASAADLARFRPPPAFFGYSAQVTDDALQRIACVVADREVELASLRRQLAALRAGPAPAGPGPGPAGPAPAGPAGASFGAAGPAAASPAASRPSEAGDWPEPLGWSDASDWAEPGGPDAGPDVDGPDYGSPDYGSPDYGSPDFGSTDVGSTDVSGESR